MNAPLLSAALGRPQLGDVHHRGPVLAGAPACRVHESGLLAHYRRGPLDAHPAIAAELLARSPSALVRIVEDAAQSLARRLGAGHLLAVMGDPRIVALNPTMLAVPGGATHVGLAAHAVKTVMRQFAGLELDPAWIEQEVPRHAVWLKPYRIAKYPVTNFEYRVFLEETSHPELPDSWAHGRYPREYANHPVHTLSPQAAQAYAEWLSARIGRRFRLPSEAEWEHAAGAGDGRVFPWGDSFVADCANTAETGLLGSTPVGAFPAGVSPFGCQDMAGNVEEYVRDEYRPYPGGRFVHGQRAGWDSGNRVARGGSFARFRDLARVARRHGHTDKARGDAMGFRLAEDVA